MAGGASDGLPAVDGILDRIGMCWWHWMLLCLAGLVMLADGAEMLVISIVAADVEAEWGLSAMDKGLLGSCVFLGFFVGSFSAGIVADHVGRRRVIIVATGWASLFSFLSAAAGSYVQLLLWRTLTGVGIGAGMPPAASLLMEYMPSGLRGRMQLLGNCFFAAGEIYIALAYASVMPYGVANDSGSGWRKLLYIAAVPCLLIFVLCVALLPSSPRFLVTAGDGDAAVAALKSVAARALPAEEADALDYEAVRQLAKRYRERKVPVQRGSVSMLLQPPFRRSSQLLAVSWAVQSFVFYGLLYALPQMYSEAGGAKSAHEDSSAMELVYSALAELPGYALAAWMVDLPAFGRKRTLVLLTFAAAFFCALAWVTYPVAFVLPTYAAKLAIGSSFAVIYIYTAELYPTSSRATAIGMGSTCSRVGGILAPLAAEMMHSRSAASPFSIFAAVGVLGAAASSLLQVDTLNVPMGKALLLAAGEETRGLLSGQDDEQDDGQDEQSGDDDSGSAAAVEGESMEQAAGGDEALPEAVVVA